MYVVTIERIPGGLAERRKTIAVIEIANTAEGPAGVLKIYEARLAQADEQIARETQVLSTKLHREPSEGVLRLVQRVLSRFLGDQPS